MRLRLRLTEDATGATVAEAIVSGVYARLGQDELSDFRHACLPPFEVSSGASGYRVAFKSQAVEVDTYVSIGLKAFTMHCTVLRERRVVHARGHCPRCGASLRVEELGGAYRSVARQRRGCARCGAEVLSLSDANALGAPQATSGDSWVRVVSPFACSGCGESMVPATLESQGRVAGVEACGPCGLVLLEPEDRLVLMGGA